jgi:deoxyadenosine/deoxycytidine kinase
VSSRERAFTVALSGPTGSGKTSVGLLLAARPSTIWVEEPNPRTRLAQMLEDGSRDGAEIQSWIVQERFRAIYDAIKRSDPCSVIIIDRTPAEDREVFFELHCRTGSMNFASLVRLNELFASIEGDVTEPDFTLFLSADQATLRSRLMVRSEGEWLCTHLELQLKLYREYYERLIARGQHVLLIDTSGFGAEQLHGLADECWSAITGARATLSTG